MDAPSLYSSTMASILTKTALSTYSRASFLNLGSRNTHTLHQLAYLPFKTCGREKIAGAKQALCRERVFHDCAQICRRLLHNFRPLPSPLAHVAGNSTNQSTTSSLSTMSELNSIDSNSAWLLTSTMVGSPSAGAFCGGRKPQSIIRGIKVRDWRVRRGAWSADRRAREADRWCIGARLYAVAIARRPSPRNARAGRSMLMSTNPSLWKPLALSCQSIIHMRTICVVHTRAHECAHCFTCLLSQTHTLDAAATRELATRKNWNQETSESRCPPHSDVHTHTHGRGLPRRGNPACAALAQLPATARVSRQDLCTNCVS
jgi:hypothetical protein